MPKSKRKAPSLGAAGDTVATRYVRAYVVPFHKQWIGRTDGAGFLLDLAADAFFDPADPTQFQTASKRAVFYAFLEPPAFDLPLDENSPQLPSLTQEDAERALAFLVEQTMVVVDGDAVSIHPRFGDILNQSPPQGDLNI
jgi:hypothetical protein